MLLGYQNWPGEAIDTQYYAHDLYIQIVYKNIEGAIYCSSVDMHKFIFLTMLLSDKNI